jgi:hypothetical protein
MTGPEHYIEAERLLSGRNSLPEYDARPTAEDIAAAQVHATLALAAATATQTSVSAFGADINHRDVDAWDDAASAGSAYEGMTNSDVMGTDELYEMDRDAEFAHDAAADELDGSDPR